MTAYFSDLNWVCTDTTVGLRFYFLGDECVCASFQPGRKCDEQFEWVSQEAYNKVKTLVFDKMKNDLSKNCAAIVDWNQIVKE